ncbi:MAG: tRNA uridine-5-carboxymethylaminomethyl(34) synthesis GTPase MnmE [Anaerolineaceae bacterium 4572_78]|nr:MAG: tRNA uridine-5-carboxymethylaminomethyl(34) synthesis GTPase MnmE [Anaerolineaceae bacterium 4572_78]
MIFSLDDTIVAIATPLGSGGIGIVRLSGSNSLPIVQKIFRPTNKRLTNLKPRYLHFGKIIHPETHFPIDEALVAYMPKPHSYTCQDVVEIQSHGSTIALQQILQLVLSLGARPAEAGEMTLRAFINGRLDLTQAEAVLDIINAKTTAGLRIATQQLSGVLSVPVSQVRHKLVNTLAFLEASIDFVEDDIPYENVIPPLQEVITELEQLISTASHGMIYRQGIRTAIVGKPNVGKSSLLNALLRGERAIVTDIPGTTRDTLEETANIHGIPLVLVDTAGIRTKASDTVEKIGIDRSHQNKTTILILNKCDLPHICVIPENFLPETPHVYLSALKGDGLEKLENTITNQIIGGHVVSADEPIISNPRHVALLKQAVLFTQEAITAHVAGLSPDLVSIDVCEAVDVLGQITGESATEDLLNIIFSRFCIGK